jgi:hypothetical protein
VSVAAPSPRLLRPVGPPLGLYIRPGRNDHAALLALFAEGHTDMSGLVLSPSLEDRHAELRGEAQRHGLETVLDPRSVELATPGGITRSGVAMLPWAGGQLPHSPETLGGANATLAAERLAQHVVAKRYSAVLAMTHYITDLRDPWFAVDAQLAQALRRALDAAGGQEVCIYYPLAVPGALLRVPENRAHLIATLAKLPIDALWLRVQGFGTTSSGPLALRRYIEASRDLHRLGIPLVGERTGTVGLALLAFGAVGGIESGITLGERYDVQALLKPPTTGTPFALPPRIYIPSIGAFLSRAQAHELFEHRRMAALFGCRVSGCCRNGASGMETNPKRHFLLRRTSEVTLCGGPPAPLRPGLYLEDFLRPATDLALRATRVLPALEPTQRRLEGWRNTLGALHRQGPPTTVAVAPEAKRIRPRQQMGA